MHTTTTVRGARIQCRGAYYCSTSQYAPPLRAAQGAREAPSVQPGSEFASSLVLLATTTVVLLLLRPTSSKKYSNSSITNNFFFSFKHCSYPHQRASQRRASSVVMRASVIITSGTTTVLQLLYYFLAGCSFRPRSPYCSSYCTSSTFTIWHTSKYCRSGILLLRISQCGRGW